jgi:hypothetical protein
VTKKHSAFRTHRAVRFRTSPFEPLRNETPFVFPVVVVVASSTVLVVTSFAESRYGHSQ